MCWQNCIWNGPSPSFEPIFTWEKQQWLKSTVTLQEVPQKTLWNGQAKQKQPSFQALSKHEMYNRTPKTSWRSAQSKRNSLSLELGSLLLVSAHPSCLPSGHCSKCHLGCGRIPKALQVAPISSKSRASSDGLKLELRPTLFGGLSIISKPTKHRGSCSSPFFTKPRVSADKSHAHRWYRSMELPRHSKPTSDPAHYTP